MNLASVIITKRRVQDVLRSAGVSCRVYCFAISKIPRRAWKGNVMNVRENIVRFWGGKNWLRNVPTWEVYRLKTRVFSYLLVVKEINCYVRTLLFSCLCLSLCLCSIIQTSGVPRGGGFGVFNPPPEIPKFWQSCIWLQIERKMFSVPIQSILISLKIAEFRMPTPQDIRKRAVKF